MNSNITTSEWKVMKVLWERSPLSLKEIVSQLKTEISWSNTTVRTLIVRLMDKGFVEADKSTGNFKYSPVILKEECQGREAKNLLDTVFEGSMKMLVSAFVNDKKLSKKDYEELVQIIQNMEESRGEE